MLEGVGEGEDPREGVDVLCPTRPYSYGLGSGPGGGEAASERCIQDACAEGSKLGMCSFA